MRRSSLILLSINGTKHAESGSGRRAPGQGYCAGRGGSCPRERFWCRESSIWASATTKATEYKGTNMKRA